MKILNDLQVLTSHRKIELHNSASGIVLKMDIEGSKSNVLVHIAVYGLLSAFAFILMEWDINYRHENEALP